MIVVLAHMLLPRQFKSDLLVLNVVESALQISVSAVTYAFIKDRNDNSTTVHVVVDIDGLPQASKQNENDQVLLVHTPPGMGVIF